jgi:6-phosphogluconate dehydrogenase
MTSEQPEQQCAIGMIGLGVIGLNLVHHPCDYFGADTYERIDAKGAFHTQWETE